MNPPDAKLNDEWCDRSCPHFKPYDHPYFNHCVWCSYLMKGLSFWDGTIARCLKEEPQEELIRAEQILKKWKDR